MTGAPGLKSRPAVTKFAFADCTTASPTKAGFVTADRISIPEKSLWLDAEAAETQARS